MAHCMWHRWNDFSGITVLLGEERGGNCILITVLMVLRSARWKVLYRYAQNKSTLCSSPPLCLHFVPSTAACPGSRPSPLPSAARPDPGCLPRDGAAPLRVGILREGRSRTQRAITCRWHNIAHRRRIIGLVWLWWGHSGVETCRFCTIKGIILHLCAPDVFLLKCIVSYGVWEAPD